MEAYDLDNDIGENKNIIVTHPEVVKRLKMHLKAFAQDIPENSRPAAIVEDPKPLTKGRERPKT